MEFPTVGLTYQSALVVALSKYSQLVSWENANSTSARTGRLTPAGPSRLRHRPSRSCPGSDNSTPPDTLDLLPHSVWATACLVPLSATVCSATVFRFSRSTRPSHSALLPHTFCPRHTNSAVATLCSLYLSIFPFPVLRLTEVSFAFVFFCFASHRLNLLLCCFQALLDPSCSCTIIFIMNGSTSAPVLG